MANLFPSYEKAPSLRAALTQRCALGRYAILLIVAFTVINLLMLVSQTFAYFLFSANLPYLLVDFGMYFGGAYTNVDPALYEQGFGALGMGFFYGMLAATVALLATYFVCWLCSSERCGRCLVTALVLFAIDTVVMLASLLISEFNAAFVIDLACHAILLFLLVDGIRADRQLRALPPAGSSVPMPEESGF